MLHMWHFLISLCAIAQDNFLYALYLKHHKHKMNATLKFIKSMTSFAIDVSGFTVASVMTEIRNYMTV